MTIEYFWLEAIWILALIFANGFFAASEIAVITMRKSRIDALLVRKQALPTTRRRLVLICREGNVQADGVGEGTAGTDRDDLVFVGLRVGEPRCDGLEQRLALGAE